MQVDKIIELIDRYANDLYVLGDDKKGVVPRPPAHLANNLLLIRGLLLRLVDKVAEAEADYRQAKGARFDRFLKEGTKRSPAFELLEMESDLVEKKIATERLRNYMKYTDGLCTSIQSVLRVQSSSDKNQY